MSDPQEQDIFIPLILAANYRCSLQLVQALIESGAQINTCDSAGVSVLTTFALQKWKADIGKYKWPDGILCILKLLKEGADLSLIDNEDFNRIRD